MPKALCLIGMVVAGLVFLVFLLDLVFGMLGMTGLAPFQMANWIMDLTFVLAAAALGYLGWSSFREQK